MGENTGIKDKHGKPIHVGDTVQFRLSDAGRLEVVEKRKQGYVTVHRHYWFKPSVTRLDQHRAQYLTVVDRAH